MSLSPSRLARNPRTARSAWLFAAALFAAAAVALVWSHPGAGLLEKARTLVSAPAPTDEGQAQNPMALMHAAAAKEKVRGMKAYWSEHKARLQQLLGVDYPAALARRDARYPQLEAIVKFGQTYNTSFERQSVDDEQHAEKQFKQNEGKLRELEAQHRGVAAELLFYGRSLADHQTVAGDVTASDLTQRFFLDDPNGLGYLQSRIAYTERHNLGDEEAAKRVEALQTTQAMLDYVQEALPRWEAAQAQVYAEAGFDKLSSDYMADSAYTGLMLPITRYYQEHANTELTAIDKESDAILQAMDEPLLAAASRDDPESRHLLTELKDLILLRQQRKPK